MAAFCGISSRSTLFVNAPFLELYMSPQLCTLDSRQVIALNDSSFSFAILT